jgi:hypothetical protein
MEGCKVIPTPPFMFINMSRESLMEDTLIGGSRMPLLPTATGRR